MHSFRSVWLWGGSDSPDLPWILSNQHVRLTAGDGVDWQFHWWHHEALADWQPQPLAQTVEWSVLAQPQDLNVNQTSVTFHYSTQTYTVQYIQK